MCEGSLEVPPNVSSSDDNSLKISFKTCYSDFPEFLVYLERFHLHIELQFVFLKRVITTADFVDSFSS